MAGRLGGRWRQWRPQSSPISSAWRTVRRLRDCGRIKDETHLALEADARAAGRTSSGRLCWVAGRALGAPDRKLRVESERRKALGSAKSPLSCRHLSRVSPASPRPLERRQQCPRNLDRCELALGSRLWAVGSPTVRNALVGRMSGPAALRALVAALVVGLAAAQWLNEPADGTGDGGGSGGDGNTTGTAASLQLCNSTGGWRSTALAQRPTANDEFRPETADYWRGPVAHAAWPALLGLAAAAALLLLFLLW